MTTQEAINLVLSNPKIAQQSATHKANVANYETETNTLNSNIKSAQDALNQAFANKADGNTLQQLADNLLKAKNAYAESQQKWGPEYTGVKKTISGAKFGISTPTGVTFTTAQKQSQNPLYNPLYDPSSDEYKSNLSALNAAPQIKNPISASTPQIKPSVDTSSLTQAVQNKSSTPSITLPSIFQQNQNTAPSIYPPASQGIKMPTLSGRTSGSNWSDLLSVAHNRYTR